MNLEMNLIEYRGTMPVIEGTSRRFASTAAVIGQASIGAGAWLDEHVVIRADGNYVAAGAELMLGERTTIHIAHELYPTIVGDRVTVGEYAVLHACSVGDDCVIEDGAVLLDGSVLAAGAVLTAGSFVYPRKRLEGGFIYEGRPAKPVRRLEPGELAARRAELRARIERREGLEAVDQELVVAPDGVFVANNAVLRGRIVPTSQAQVYYSCELDAGSGEIVLGERCNVQDNSLLRAGDGRIVIGAGSTIGHNVRMQGCSVGERSLVGIGAVLAAGTMIGDDVFVAGGAATEPGQVLESGFWTGTPARRVGDLDDAKRRIIAFTTPTYCEYAAELARTQAAQAARG